jgi:hypothetical protein
VGLQYALLLLYVCNAEYSLRRCALPGVLLHMQLTSEHMTAEMQFIGLEACDNVAAPSIDTHNKCAAES